MNQLETTETLSVNRNRFPAFLAGKPIYSDDGIAGMTVLFPPLADYASTTSETLVTWSTPVDQAVSYDSAKPCNGTIRHYDPTVGRFLSNDPIGISGGLNQYVFCGNNPVNARDPFGLCPAGDGEKYVQQYLKDLNKDWMTFRPWNIYKWSTECERDLAIKHFGESYVWRGYKMRSDMMGNAGPGYAFTKKFGPEIAGLVCVGAEGAGALADRSWGPADAVGSFTGNALGANEAIKEAGWKNLNDYIITIYSQLGMPIVLH